MVMRKAKFLLITFAIGLMFVTVQGAGAGFKLCLDLANHCKTPSLFSQGICIGYLEALADAGTAGICIPVEVTPKQLQELFLKIVAEHPEEAATDAPTCFRAAMRGVYRCD